MSDIIQIQEQPSITISIVGGAGPTISATDGFYIPDWGSISNKPDFDSLYYPLSNPSGFITGGDFATNTQLSNSGAFLVSLNASTSGALTASISALQAQTGSYYPRSNPSGYVAGSVLRPNTYTLYDASTSLSLDWNVQQLYSDGFLAADWRSRTLNDGLGATSLDWTNRSLLGAWTLDAQATGNNDVVNLAALAAYAYPLSNPSGFATGIDTSIFVLKSETGSYSLLFYPLSANPSGYVTGDVVRPSQTGLFLTSSSLSGYATQTYVNNASGALRTDISYLQALTGGYYPANNPSGFITGFNSGDYVTGQVVRPSETGNFATQSYVVGVSGAIRTDISSIQSATGGYTGLFYPLASNPSGYITGLVVRPSETGNFILNSQTGLFYPFYNPSGYITGVDTGNFVLSSETGVFITSSQTGQFYPMSNPSGFATGIDSSNFVLKSETGSYTGIFYPLLQNPSGYITGSVVRPNETGNFLTVNSGNALYVNITGSETILGDKTFTGKVVTQDGIDSNGNIVISKGNPRLQFRDSSAGGHSQGFDIHVSTDRFYIDDNTHGLNILDYNYDGADHTLYAGEGAITKLGTSGAVEITADPFVYIRGANRNMVFSSEEYSLFDISGATSLHFDEKSLYGEWLNGYTGTLNSEFSIVNRRALYGYSYPLDGNPSGYVTGSVVRPSDTGTFLSSIPSDVVRTTGNQVISGKKSFITGLYNTGGALLVDLAANRVYHPNGSLTIDWYDRQLRSFGDFYSVDWAYRGLYDEYNVQSADWNARYLTDSSTSLSFDWQNRKMVASDMSESVNWEARILTGGVWKSNGVATSSGDIVNYFSLTGYSYPLAGNPSGYVTGQVVRPSETGQFVAQSQTGLFYPMSNPSGFATGIDSSNFVIIDQTGAFYSSSNPSGYVSSSYVDSISRVSSLAGITGVVSITGAGSITTSVAAQGIIISGNESSSSPQIGSIGIYANSEVGFLDSGLVARVVCPFDIDISGWLLCGDVTGNISCVVSGSLFSSYPAFEEYSVAPVSLTNQIKNSGTCSGWTSSLNKGDVLQIGISGVSGISSMNFVITGLKR